MKFIQLSLPGLFLIEPTVYGDNRGFFFESYNQQIFADNGINVNFIQDNHSRSETNILRGLHLQLPPTAQAKLIRVVAGEVLDVVVDVRPNSPTFGKHETIHLSEENKNILFIPHGFLHGFYVLSGPADFLYKVDNYYNKDSELGVMWNDPILAINWPCHQPTLSTKDQQNKSFAETQKLFTTFSV